MEDQRTSVQLKQIPLSPFDRFCRFILEAPRRFRTSEKYKSFGYNILTLLVFLMVWSLVSWLMESPFFPGPIMIIKAFGDLCLNGDIEGVKMGMHVFQSLVRIFGGFATACLLGIPLGLLMGLYGQIYDSTKGVIEPIRFIPPVAWIPLVIVLLVGYFRFVFIIWLGAFFPIFIGTLLSVRGVNPIHIEVPKSFGATRLFIVRNIILPSVLPEVLTSMRVGLGIAWECIMAAEMIGGERVGIGIMILKYAQLIRMEYIIVGIIVIGLIGFFLNEIFIFVEKRIFRWKEVVSI
ncbi:MAG: ABC transporter permease [Thermodesulfobacteriota bacterium]